MSVGKWLYVFIKPCIAFFLQLNFFLWCQNLSGFAQEPEYVLFYQIVPKEKIIAEIKKQTYPRMKKKGILEPDIQARYASQLSAIADSIASAFRYQSDFRKIALGDSILLKKQQTPINKSRWERNLLTMIERLTNSGSAQWNNLLARNYSDRIIIFHSAVKVLPSAKLEVEETIIIYNGNGRRSSDIDYNVNNDPNDDIQRGIVRDFPTRYLHKDGFWANVGFELKSVTRNGNISNYKTESIDNGTRIMVGDADILIEEGLHRYVFTYETDRQIIYHNNKDELYWNVNGSGWVFSADSVSCTIQFPAGSTIFENACYTGHQGSNERNCSSIQLNDSTIHFWNTNRLDAWQGLTVAAAIEKGILAEAAPRTLKTILQDNYGIPVLGTTFSALTLFYFLAWYFKGRDPKKGTIIPQLEPPAELSPADVGYIDQQVYGSHLFAAALVDMAVHKYLKIDVDTKKFVFKWTVYNFKQPSGKITGDGYPMYSLYGFRPADIYGETAEKGKYNPTLKKCYDGLKTKLEDRFKIRRGKKNTWHGLFVRNDGFTGCGGLIVVGAVIFGAIYAISQFTLNILGITGLLVVAIMILHSVFVKIMSAYTLKGREIMDHIEGFKMYLETAEQNLFQYFTPPEKSLVLFEKYLPYAIALKVENAWAEKFDDIMQRAVEGGYQPTYYSGSSDSFGRSFSAGAMTTILSAGLGSSTASASTPPSSSSGGSSGGGSSGGGGGGGGGGGW